MAWRLTTSELVSLRGDVNDLTGRITTNIPNKFEDKLFIFCGDSTTEQAVTTQGMFERLTDFYSRNDQIFAGATGYVNYGGSGQTLDDFLTRVTPDFVGAAENTPTWNYAGVKPAGAVGLEDAVLTPSGDIYVVCYGINDLILHASLGNQTEDQIIAVLAPKLVTAIQRMQLARPTGGMILRTPNAMTARPVDPAFPSPTEYPTWGDDLATDQALMLKWNNALRRIYIEAAQILGSSVLLVDTLRYSIPDRGVDVSAADNVAMNDLVHPSNHGYNAMADGLVSVLEPRQPVRGPVALAVRQEASDATPVYSYYPEYVIDRTDGLDKLITTKLVNSGASFLDIDVPQPFFTSNVKDAPIYVYFDNIGTLKFDSYNPAVLGNQTRLLGISVPVEFQGAEPTDITIYQDSNIKPVFASVTSLETLKNLYVFDYTSDELSSIKINTGIDAGVNVVFDIYNIRSTSRTKLNAGSGTVFNGQTNATLAITPTTFVDGDTLEVVVTSPVSYVGSSILRVEL